MIKKEGSPDTVRLFVTDEHATDTFLRPPANPFLITQAFFYDFTPEVGSNTMAIAALVTDERVARVTLDGLSTPITATVDHGTLLLPGVTGQGPLRLTLTLTDSDGTTLGTLPIGA